MNNCGNYADIVIRDTGSVFVTRRIALTMRGTSGFSIDPGADTVAYHAECKAHRIKIEVSALQAEYVEDSVAFCPECLAGSPQKKIDPTAEAMRRLLTGTQVNRKDTEDIKRWRVGKAFVRFIDKIDLDL